MPVSRVLLVVAAVVVALGFVSTQPWGDQSRDRSTDRPTAPRRATPPAERAVVVRVVDGDTLVVQVGGATERVRVLGIDTPEVDPAECGADRATAQARRLLPAGAIVRLVGDRSQADRDRYDRLLRYVERGGRDVGRLLVARGWARVFVFQGHPFDRTDDYRSAERAARGAHRGAWHAC